MSASINASRRFPKSDASILIRISDVRDSGSVGELVRALNLLIALRWLVREHCRELKSVKL